MYKYPKIQTVFLRDPDTNYKKLLIGQFSKPEFEYLAENKWVFTEKVDGTNIRILWDGLSLEFRGRTDKAEIPNFLLSKLVDMFQPQTFYYHKLPPLCLYGEGYGAKIQKGGGNYISDGCSFILFDVLIGDVWLDRLSVEAVGSKLKCECVPIIGTGSLFYGIQKVEQGFASLLRDTPPEGLIMKPKIEMKNHRGERVITKLKIRDF